MQQAADHTTIPKYNLTSCIPPWCQICYKGCIRYRDKLYQNCQWHAAPPPPPKHFRVGNDKFRFKRRELLWLQSVRLKKLGFQAYLIKPRHTHRIHISQSSFTVEVKSPPNSTIKACNTITRKHDFVNRAGRTPSTGNANKALTARLHNGPGHCVFKRSFS